MNDPYMPLELHYDLTGRALDLIARYGFGVHVITKSDLVVRDIPRLLAIGPARARVFFSISTTDDGLSRKIEPGAPVVSSRFAAMRALADHNIPVGVCLMPVLPFIEDSIENITAVVKRAVENGASFIVPWFGMSMRDRQREHFYTQLDRLFPGLRARYERTYGDQYGCPAPGANRLAEVFRALCMQYGLAVRVPAPDVSAAKKDAGKQLSLF